MRWKQKEGKEEDGKHGSKCIFPRLVSKGKGKDGKVAIIPMNFSFLGASADLFKIPFIPYCIKLNK